jgi:hypothetical protein
MTKKVTVKEEATDLNLCFVTLQSKSITAKGAKRAPSDDWTSLCIFRHLVILTIGASDPSVACSIY